MNPLHFEYINLKIITVRIRMNGQRRRQRAMTNNEARQ